MALCYFNGCQGDTQIWQLGQGLSAVGHGKASLIELLDNKGGLGLGYNPTSE